MKVNGYNRFQALLRIDEFNDYIDKINKADYSEYHYLILKFKYIFIVDFDDVLYLKSLLNTELEDKDHFDMLLNIERSVDVIETKNDVQETNYDRLGYDPYIIEDQSIPNLKVENPYAPNANRENLHLTANGGLLQISIDLSMPKEKIKADLGDLVDHYFRSLGRDKTKIPEIEIANFQYGKFTICTTLKILV